jgi:hypothetical protein
VTEACDVAVTEDSHHTWKKRKVLAIDLDALGDQVSNNCLSGC